jgi:hypothetical protein
MNKFTKAATVLKDYVNLRQVGRPKRLWETRGSRLPLRGVIRLSIGIGSVRNLDGPRRRGPTGRGPRAVSAEVPLGGECYRLERLIPQLGLNHQ